MENTLKGIQLLEGQKTVNGQIKARIQALVYCLADNGDTYPSLVLSWIDEHVLVLKQLYKTKNANKYKKNKGNGLTRQKVYITI